MNAGAGAPTQRPVLGVMGVSGCGRSTVAGGADQTQWSGDRTELSF